MKTFEQYYTIENANRIVDIINSDEALKKMISDYLNGLGTELSEKEARLCKARLVLETLANVGGEM